MNDQQKKFLIDKFDIIEFDSRKRPKAEGSDGIGLNMEDFYKIANFMVKLENENKHIKERLEIVEEVLITILKRRKKHDRNKIQKQIRRRDNKTKTGKKTHNQKK